MLPWTTKHTPGNNTDTTEAGGRHNQGRRDKNEKAGMNALQTARQGPRPLLERQPSLRQCVSFFLEYPPNAVNRGDAHLMRMPEEVGNLRARVTHPSSHRRNAFKTFPVSYPQPGTIGDWKFSNEKGVYDLHRKPLKSLVELKRIELLTS